MKFKKWMQNENIDKPMDLVRYYRDISSKDAGAFYQGGGDPPPPSTKSPTADYLSPKHRTKWMLKKMKKS